MIRHILKLATAQKSKRRLATVTPEAATGGALYKKVFLKISQNSQENTCGRVSFLKKGLHFMKKETLVQVFSC